ncbi:MAG TPA: DUF3987 domain-containing protein [Burkholderiaceae bacterium]|nr:DUF3987 domain-containing protein [Burkholderiaceae bacterium]
MTHQKEKPRGQGGVSENDNTTTFDNRNRATDSSVRQLDIRQTLDFAEKLAGSSDSDLTFAAFHPEGTETEHKPKVWRASVKDAWAKIERLQALGYGVYVTVNQTAGRGRKADDITGVRAVWVDADTIAPICEDWHLPPHLIVESSPGKHHYYWFTDALPSPADFSAVTKAMCTVHPHIGGDTNAGDIARVLRLPGTLHLKNPAKPHLVRIVGEHPSQARYTWDQITQAFPPLLATANSDRPRFEIGTALQTVKSANEGLHAALRDVAAHFASVGVHPEIAEDMLSGYAENYSDGTARYKERLTEIPRLVKSAYQKFALAGFSEETSKPGGPLNLFASGHQQSPTFNPQHYPDTIANLAADIAYRMGCDPLIPAWTALVAAAGITPDKLKVQVKANDHTWRESPRLWAAVVGDPSTQKSPPMSAVISPIEDIQRNYATQYDFEMGKWRDRLAIARKNKDTEPEPPQMRRLLAHDATTESLANILHSNPAGMLVVQDELSAWFGGMDAYRQAGTSKDRGFWLQAYNGAPYTVDRVKGSIFIPNLSVSIIGGIQPGPMLDIAGKLGDDGLLQRFICIPIRAAGVDADVTPDIAAITAWRALIEELAAVRDGQFIWPELFRMSPAAQEKVDNARRRLREIAASPANDRRITAALGKGAGQLMRLVLTFHLIENRTGEDLFSDGAVPSEIIEESTAEKAIRLFFELVIPATFDFYARIIGESELQRQARRVAGYILAHGCGTISDRDIYREALKELRDDERGRADVMRQLEMAGWIAPKKELRGRITQWDVSPAVHVKFAAQATAERERRAQVVSEIRGYASSDKMDK